jgi:hypothetical protein
MNCPVCTLGVNIYFLAGLDKSYKNTKCAGYVIDFVLQVICTGLNLYYNRLEHTGVGVEISTNKCVRLSFICIVTYCKNKS